MDRADVMTLLRQTAAGIDSSSPFDMEAYEARKIARYNATRGKLDSTVIDCPVCLNRGNIARRIKTDVGYMSTIFEPCRCMAARDSLSRMRKSGLADSLSRCKFATFQATEPWQTHMCRIACEYVKNGLRAGRWLYLGGAVGSGKTHLCTAVCGKALDMGMSVHYMCWQSESVDIKNTLGSAEEYAARMARLKNVDLLYIDDFFKPSYQGGEPVPPTAADVKLAYDIINTRYIAQKPTLISSEWYDVELIDIDAATGSRVREMSRGFGANITRDNGRNYRLRE